MDISRGTAAENVTPLDWATFGGIKSLAEFFQYFTPLSYKIDLIGYTPSVTSNILALSLMPIDYTSSPTSSTPPNIANMLAMKGVIEVMPGAKNHG